MSTLEHDVSAAQEALLRVAGEQPGWWDPRELRETARNGWSGDVMMYALTDLVNRGALVLNEKLCVRLPEPA